MYTKDPWPSVDHPTERPNFYIVHLGDGRSVAFSYQTPIGFHTVGEGWTVRENDWSNTTGRHLNYLDDGNKADRLQGDAFELALRRYMGADDA